MFEIMSTILIVVLILVLVSPIAIFLIAVIDFVCEIIESNRDVEVVVRDYCSAVKKIQQGRGSVENTAQKVVINDV